MVSFPSCRMPGYPDVPLDGLWGFPPFSNSTLSCTPGECDPPDWSLPLPEAIARVGVCVLVVVLRFFASNWNLSMPCAIISRHKN